jgi:hypothetical protein
VLDRADLEAHYGGAPAEHFGVEDDDGALIGSDTGFRVE